MTVGCIGEPTVKELLVELNRESQIELPHGPGEALCPVCVGYEAVLLIF